MSRELSGAQIEEIHPDINISYNSFNVIIQTYKEEKEK